MNALANVVEFQLPKRKPKIVEKAGEPDQRAFSVVPLRAARDERLTAGDIRALVILCSYANRAGLTWVSQKRIGQDLNVTRQAIGKHMKRLRECGYIKTVSNSFRGEKATTLQIIYKEGVEPEDAVAITSSIEDTRSPEMVKADKKAAEGHQERLAADGLPDISEEQAAANRERLRAMLSNWSSPNFRTHQPQRIGDLMPRAKQKPVGNSRVANGDTKTGNRRVANEASIGNHIGNPIVAQTQKNIGLHEVIGVLETHVVKNNVQATIDETAMRAIELLVEVGCSQAALESHLQAADLSRGVSQVLCDLIETRA